MRGRLIAAVLAVTSAAGLASCAGTAPGPASASGIAVEAPGTAALDDTSGDDGKDLVYPALNSVSCTRPGDCVAVGNYSGGFQASMLVIGERGGAWRKALPLPAVPVMDAGGNEWPNTGLISCSAPGNCAVVGSDGNSLALMAASESNGTWTAARYIRGLTWYGGGSGTYWRGLSCSPSPGYCAAGGSRANQAFVVSERSGVWEPAHLLPGRTAITSVSCPAAGTCLAGGGEPPVTYPAGPAFLVSERTGRWGAAEPVPGLAALIGHGMASAVSSVSCASPGNCAVAGTIQRPGTFSTTVQDQFSVQRVWVAGETNGRWSAATPVPGLHALDRGGSAEVTQVSCAGAGSCAAGGWYVTFQGRRPEQQAWVAMETRGHWLPAHTVASALNVGRYAKVETVSCGAPGDCIAAGVYAAAKGAPYYSPVNAFVVRSSHGIWGAAERVPGVTTAKGGSDLTSVSCVPGWCAAVGTYLTSKGPQLFVVNLP